MKINLHDPEQVIEALRLLRERDDTSRWKSGDVAGAYLSQFEHGQRGEELNRLAAHSGYTRDGLRERVECSTFYPVERRQWDNSVTWSHYNRARRGFDLDTACKLLAKSDEETWSVAQFEMYCQQVKAERDGPPPPPTDQEVKGMLEAVRVKLFQLADLMPTSNGREYVLAATDELKDAMEAIE